MKSMRLRWASNAMLIGSWIAVAMWLKPTRLETDADSKDVSMTTSVPADADPLLGAPRT